MLRVLEISWLMVALTGSSLGIYKTCTYDFTHAIYIFLFTTIALFAYISKRKQRIEFDKLKKEEEK